MDKPNLPANWFWVKLGDVCEAVAKVNDFNKRGSFQYLDIGGINNKTNSIESVKEYEWKKAPSRAKQIIQKGDILFSTVRTYLKNIAKVPAKYNNQIASTGFCIIRPKRNLLNTEYVFYLALFDKFLEPLNALQVGSSYPAVRNGDVLKQNIPLPPLPEQKKIVAKIEELFSELDNGIEQLAAAKEQLKIYRQAVLSWAFSGKLIREVGSLRLAVVKEEMMKAAEPEVPYNGNGLPKGWKWVKLREVCIKIQDGSHFSPKNQYSKKDEGQYLYLTSKNIRNNYLDLRDVAYVDKKFHDSIFHRCNPEYGDVLLTKDGANTGNVTLNTLTEEFSLLSSVCLIKPNKEKLKSQFVKYYLQSPIGFKEITGAMTGTAIKRIILKNIKEAKIVLPPQDQQHQIVSEIESRFSVADKLEQTIDENLKKSETLRQSILKKAFEGRLV